MFIDLQTPKAELRTFLEDLNFIKDHTETITKLTKPGEGNMNVVLRVETNLRSFIVKQSRPFVQKYQDIKAPIERIDVEYQFYTTIANNSELHPYFPKVLKYSAEHHLLILEDLGACEDMTLLYAAHKIEDTQLELLVQIAAHIHSSETPQGYPKNRALRELNYQHIFELPFIENNGFSLDEIQPGLEALSTTYKTDKALKEKIKVLGDAYLSEGTTLMHGDYYPASWMTNKDALYIIDPEFSFLGFPEFDLGVLAAHAILITKDASFISKIEAYYPHKIDASRLAQITGIEIMRRLIGLAQLPLTASIKEKDALLQLAYKLIMKTS
ncbi:phosphotransferase [Winogradskyella rapida]|uniref:Phosphotransferase n=1 Tax=Winogradskyella rapida TaxID=549701 RepID=A0ABW3KS30_9FLAO